MDAGDIAAVAAEALTSDGHAGRTYALTGPEALTSDEMAAVLSRAAGRETNHVRMSPAAFAEMLAGMDVSQWLAEDLATTYEIFAAGQGVEVSDDIATVTGRQPRTFDAFAGESSLTCSRPAPSRWPGDQRGAFGVGAPGMANHALVFSRAGGGMARAWLTHRRAHPRRIPKTGPRAMSR